MAKQVDDHGIIDIGAQHKLFLLEDRDLNPKFTLGLWYRDQVEAGKVWRVYRDGKQYDDWEAGPHVLWNSLWHRWRALIINIRTVHIDFAVEGRVRGPQLAQETSSAAGVDLGCTVRARMELPCSVVVEKIGRFLQYENPLSVFGASLNSMVIELIRDLPYDQFGSWATTLRNQIWDNLNSPGGRYDMVNRIGMNVEEVFVTSVEPDSLVDRNRIAMYQLVERAKRELVEAQGNKDRHQVVAEDFEKQGSILNIAPSILALQNSPIGKELIARDASLREMMLAAGLNPSISLHPIRDSQSAFGAGGSPGAYLNPPNPSRPVSQTPYGEAGANPSSTVSGELQWTGRQSRQFSSSPPSASPSMTERAAIDPARQDQELAALQSARFQYAGRGQLSPTYDSNGHPIAGSMEWTLEVYIERINGYITVVFHCPPGYPSVPPRVQVRLPGVGGLRSRTTEVVARWSEQHMLVEIVQEIDDTTP